MAFPCQILSKENCSSVFFNFLVLLILWVLPFASSVSFSYSSFPANTPNIVFEGDAFPSNDVLQLTKNQADINLTRSLGRATYSQPVIIWDPKTRKLTDFTTHFSFIIKAVNTSNNGDGITFFFAPFDSTIPDNSTGGYLALFSPETAKLNTSKQIVAVEFDSFQNSWDPSSDHVGINVNSIISVTTVNWKSSIKDGRRANAWVSYNSSTQNLSVFLTYADNPVFSGNSSLWYIVDLRKFLPERVKVGFSASTSEVVEIHNIISWNFTSTLDENKGKPNVGLIVGLTVGTGALICGLGVIWFIRWKKRAGVNKEDEAIDEAMDDEFEKGTGPKRFTYRELNKATNSFAEEGKLGEGGFGGVYKGLLSDQKTEVAVKRVSRRSKQGKKEYVSEVRIISRLRHRNLVQLYGWCHQQGELLLVYEFMPNGSLDAHLFGGKATLSWAIRYKIALGLASALLYLHEEWEQCVVHRDIKSSNVMLDSNFNAKLGDFGLARLVDHDSTSQTTVLAGTMGYLAPECVTTGKASKESDVYSFGVVALEITCGRRPVESREEPSKVRLVEWVWGLYGKGQLHEAADKRLMRDFDERQMECLMIIGLWCCHPDYTLRPSIRQVINALNFEAPLPSLPSKLPVPTYYAPPMDMSKFTYTTSGVTQSSVNSNSTCSLTSVGSTTALFNSRKVD
ncbi:LOW QUALITY PROTEIN: L-type lectin-domain containing receptor kinase IX.1-like [Mangifera indica]|uniref:LOW QUALITY PROTEIN: L-type lectin-domain containing receptor kinase IX.1-like n=1 Tax=Mangifera indica TaxID=29780 RepID=UPI001CFAD8BF|nr:LOW QUALITY PROTEIN: L-type lectin-domain containing receptor kinase IX.1-like [Mangifera indica]